MKGQICVRKGVTFKVLHCFNGSIRTNKAALLHHRDTGVRGEGWEQGGRERGERDGAEGRSERKS